jgi:hypothetical protein
MIFIVPYAHPLENFIVAYIQMYYTCSMVRNIVFLFFLIKVDSQYKEYSIFFFYIKIRKGEVGNKRDKEKSDVSFW